MSVARRDLLRREQQRERELTERVLAAQRRLTVDQRKRDAAIDAADARIVASTERLAAAVVEYMDKAGVLPARAAAVLGIPRSAVVGMVRERRASLRRERSQDLSNPGLEADAEFTTQDERGEPASDADQ